VSSPNQQIDRDWLNYFDTRIAETATFAHIAALPGTKNTPEKHTAIAYSSGLYYFLEWSQDQLPTPALMKKFIAHLSTKPNQRTNGFGLSATTINSKYLAPVKLYLRALAGQHIIGDRDTTPRIVAYREQIRAASEIKNVAQDIKSNQSALLRHGTRLTKRQVNKLLDFRTHTLEAKRDRALLVSAFNTGLRLAELQRMTLSSITEHDDETYIVKVRGKRNNHDPITITDNAVDAIRDYVKAYNIGLPADDPRRIGDNTPLWQSLTRSGNHLPIGHRTGTNRKTKEPTFYSPSIGMSISGITGIIKRRAGIAPHDVRRTFAYLAFRAGMPIAAISRQMRHSSIAITQIYIGDLQDYKKSNLSNYITLG
jgi:integrase